MAQPAAGHVVMRRVRKDRQRALDGRQAVWGLWRVLKHSNAFSAGCAVQQCRAFLRDESPGLTVEARAGAAPSPGGSVFG